MQRKAFNFVQWGGMLLATLLLVACPSNVSNESDSTSESGEQQSSTETQTLENAKSDLTIQTVVTQGQDTISLPISISGFDDVTITWSSDNSIITISQNTDSCNGIVIHQNGDGSDTVNLTATLSYNGKTTTKSFTMTVYQENAELSKQEILEAAAAKLSITYDGTTYGWQNVNLQTSVTVEDKNVDVSWDTVSTDSHLTLSGNTMSVIRDIADIPLSLKATLSYDGESYETTVPFTLTHIPEFVKTTTYSSTDINTYSYIFDGSTLTLKEVYNRSDDGQEYIEGDVYSLAVNLENKTLAIKRIKRWDNHNGNIIEFTKDTYREYLTNYNAREISAWKQAYSNPTFENYCTMYNYDSSNPKEVAEVYDRLERLGYPSISIDVIIRSIIDKEIDEGRQFLGLPESVSKWDVLEAYWQLEADVELHSCFPGTETVYEYDIDYNTANTSNESWKNHLGLYAISSWPQGKRWFEGKSHWISRENDFRIKLYYYGSGDYGKFYYEFKKNGGWETTSGMALLNEAKTSFTVKPIGDSQTLIPESDRNWTITEDQPNKRIKIANPNKGDVYLYFEGKDL